MSLASLASKVETAGRGPDKNLVHMSPAELDLLRRQWGPPTINPTTGLPEYGWFDSLIQYAPAALSAFGGGGSGGFATGLGDMLGAEGPWSSVLGSALIGGAGSALMGGGIKGALTGALLGGGLSALSPLMGNALGGTDIGNWLGVGDSARDTIFGSGSGRMGVDSVSGAPTDYMSQLMSAGTDARLADYASDPGGHLMHTANMANAATAAGTGAGGAAGGGSSMSSLLKYALPLAALAGLGGGGNKGATGTPPPQQNASAKLPDLNLSLRPKDTSGIDWYTYGQRPRNATFFDPQWRDGDGKVMAARGGRIEGPAAGGALGALGRSRMGAHEFVDDAQSPRMVRGPGGGRGDKIPAMLSSGEYVLDSEVVSSLGNGDSDEGARKLDRMRENVRRHKGKALAKGRISPDAKDDPRSYMRGGRS